MDKRQRKAPKLARGEVTRDAILDATAELIRAHGVERVTMREIQTRAGVGSGSMYHFFQSRDAVLAAWELREFDRRVAMLPSLIAELKATGASLDEWARRISLFTLDYFLEHFAAYRSAADAASLFPERRDAIERVIALVAEAIDASPRRSHMHVTDARVAVRLCLSTLFFGAQRLAFAGPPASERALFRTELVEMIVRYVVRPS